MNTLAPFNCSNGRGPGRLELLTTADEVPYYRVSNFLSLQTAELILQDLLERPKEFRARGINPSGAATFYRMSTPWHPCAEFLERFADLIPALQIRFATDLGGPQLELFAQAYNDESFFGKHSDVDSGVRIGKDGSRVSITFIRIRGSSRVAA